MLHGNTNFKLFGCQEWITSHCKIFEGFNALPTNNNHQFGLNFRHTELYGCFYIKKKVKHQVLTKSSTNLREKKLRGSFIQNVDGDTIFSANDAANLEKLSQAHLQKVQGVAG